MALGSCYTCIKYLMFAFNFIFWLLGCAILGVGIWLRVDDESAEFLHLSPKVDVLYTLSYFMIGVGFVIMVIGFLGCCGAIRESQCMLGTFFAFLFIIFAGMLGVGVWTVVAKDELRETVRDVLQEGVDNYGQKDEDTSTKFMDSVQNYFECCGYKDGEADYTKVTAPPTCTDRDEACTDKLFEWLEARLVIIAGFFIGVAVVMILGMIFAMVLCCAIRDVVA